jgi:hypothetical protein
MTIGAHDQLPPIATGDTGELRTYLRINGQPITADQIASVTYTIQSPSQTQAINAGYTLPTTTLLLQSVENVPPTGTAYVVDTIGTEILTYTGISGLTLTGVSGGTTGAIINQNSPIIFLKTTVAQGTVMPDGSGFLRWTDTAQTGEYLAKCQFSLISGEKRSVITNFSIFDPFNMPEPSSTDQIVEQVMLRLEDLFDSSEGGPWLRDRTDGHFDANKVASFIPEALLDINVQMPPTNFTLDYFTMGTNDMPNPNMPILIKGVLVLTIRHLMRSYTEQWIVQGGQVVQPDRTRYQQAWGAMYTIEQADYISAVRLWKRTVLRLGHSALLTASKSGRLFPYGTERTRNIGRGYY